jgi:hypothetical protein
MQELEKAKSEAQLRITAQQRAFEERLLVRHPHLTRRRKKEKEK